MTATPLFARIFGTALALSAMCWRAAAEEPQRALSFTTDEITWMSVDVAPSGKTLVFDLLGDLHTLPIGGGVASHLTAGSGFDSQPRYSPDGKSIAFVSDRQGVDNVWIVDANGRHPRPLTHFVGNEHVVSPAWTPDGRAIAVSFYPPPLEKGESGVYLIALDGSSRKMISGTEGTISLGAAFHPRSLDLYVSRCASVWLSLGSCELKKIDSASGNEIAISRRRGGSFRPLISPRGDRLVYGTRLVTETALILRDLGSGDERVLVRQAQRDQDELDMDPSLDLMPGSSFTPDGSAVITSYGGKLWHVDVASGRVTRIPFEARVEQPLGSSVRAKSKFDENWVRGRRIRTPRFSPDGTKVAYVAFDRLYVRNLPGGVPQRVTASVSVEYAPAWSPDGQFLAYLAWDDRLSGRIFRVKADKTCPAPQLSRCKPQQLSLAPADFSGLNYSPDGKRLVVVRRSREPRMSTPAGFPLYDAAKLVWLPASGGATQVIAPIEQSILGWAGTPHFTRVHKDRVYIAERLGLDVMQLISMRWDGSDRHVHLQIKEDGADVEADMLLSPDGSRVAFASTNQIQVMPFPPQPAANPIAAKSPHRLASMEGVFPWWIAGGWDLSFSWGSSGFLCHCGEKDLPQLELPQLRRVELAVTLPADRPAGWIALRGGRLITMKGNEILEQGDVLIRDNRIVAVGSAGTIDIPADAHVIDASNLTIIPGMIDTHAHPPLDMGVHRGQVWEYLAYLAYGVTSMRDPGAPAALLEYSDRLDAGQLLGPRVFTAGPPIVPQIAPESLEEARRLLQTYSDVYRVNTVSTRNVNRKVRQWILTAARERGLNVTSERHGDFKTTVTEMQDGYSGKEHAFFVFPLYKDVIALAAQAGTLITPTLMLQNQAYFPSRENLRDDPKLRRFIPQDVIDHESLRPEWPWMHDNQYQFPFQARELAKIAAAGGLIGVGPDLKSYFGLTAHWELWALASGGIPPHTVLRMATLNGATAIGMQDHLGSLEPGKLADLVILDKDPLQDLRNSVSIRYVMKNGRLYEADTLRQVWP